MVPVSFFSASPPTATFISTAILAILLCKQVCSGFVPCLANRARYIYSNEYIQPELDNVSSLILSGFTSKEARRVYQIKNRCDASQTESKPRRCVMPFVTSFSDIISDILGRSDIRTASKPSLNLGGLLLNKKPRKAQILGLVYHIPCADCDCSYVSETGCTPYERITEHKCSVGN